LSNAHSIPLYNVYSQVAYASKAGDVEDVFVNGRPVVRDRRMLTLDAERIYERVRSLQHGIQQSLGR
jgi:5-methylthioadenosine/S-adenosylhomocysteine deaminase